MLVEGWGQERLGLIDRLVLLTTTPRTNTEPSAIGAIFKLAVLAQGTSRCSCSRSFFTYILAQLPAYLTRQVSRGGFGHAPNPYTPT